MATKIKNPIKGKHVLNDLMIAHGNNKSSVIRFLDSEGYARARIADFMEIRYQHVRNVLEMPLKKVLEETTK